MTALDDQISSAFSLLALLLVFVIGYFAAFLPLVQDVLDKDIPDVADGRTNLISGLRAYRILVGGVLLLAVMTGAVLGPLTRRVIAAISFSGPFPTIEAGLLLIDIMLLATIVMTVWLWVRIWFRIRDIHSLQ
jgi:hypothetical protein